MEIEIAPSGDYLPGVWEAPLALQRGHRAEPFCSWFPHETSSNALPTLNDQLRSAGYVNRFFKMSWSVLKFFSLVTASHQQFKNSQPTRISGVWSSWLPVHPIGTSGSQNLIEEEVLSQIQNFCTICISFKLKSSLVVVEHPVR